MRTNYFVKPHPLLQLRTRVNMKPYQWLLNLEIEGRYGIMIASVDCGAVKEKGISRSYVLR